MSDAFLKQKAWDKELVGNVMQGYGLISTSPSYTTAVDPINSPKTWTTSSAISANYYAASDTIAGIDIPNQEQ